jgi:hypothetical protein
LRLRKQGVEAVKATGPPVRLRPAARIRQAWSTCSSRKTSAVPTSLEVVGRPDSSVVRRRREDRERPVVDRPVLSADLASFEHGVDRSGLDLA